MSLRYEDVSQDGRLRLEAVPTALGAVVWPRILAWLPKGAAEPRELVKAVVPILVRLTTTGGAGPVSVTHALDGSGVFRLAHALGPGGEVDRILLDVWATLSGVRGRTHGPPPEGAGEPLELGRVFARHVFTRLFAPPGQRRVTRLEPPLPPVPGPRVAFEPLDGIATVPPGAELLEPGVSPDEARVAFGLTHTDSNQHVNSLVYPRLFEEAALRRLAKLGLGGDLLARFSDVGFRKPFFAGERARVWLVAFRLGGQLGAAGYFAPDEDGARPHAYVRMLFG